MSWRNEHMLFSRQCDKTGRRLISMYPPDTPYPVYELSEWWKEANDPIVFGRDIDFSRPVFEQIAELQTKVPRMHIYSYASERMVNSDYNNCAGDLKDCYMIFCSGRNERCLYSTAIMDSYDCVDMLFTLSSEECYECIDVENCTRLFFSQTCKECSDSYFLYDCRGSSDCIGCAGLRRKQYHIFNQPHSKEDYIQFKERIIRAGLGGLKEVEQKWQEILKKVPRRSIHGDKNQNVSGDFIRNSKNCEHCFDTYGSEDCAFCTWVGDAKDCMDFYSWGEAELSYEVSGGGDKSYRLLFSSMAQGLRDCLYTDMCNYSKNLFACVGLKNKQFCILNKEYSESEYERLVAKLIEHMRKTGEWGEFFSGQIAPLAYNQTCALEYYPLSAAEAHELGYRWSDFSSPAPGVKKMIQATDVPGSIVDIQEDILEMAILCEVTGRPFRIVKSELEFYRENKLPIPRREPIQRHRDRIQKRNPRALWERKCGKCGNHIQTSYSPERLELVYCMDCYLQEVY